MQFDALLRISGFRKSSLPASAVISDQQRVPNVVAKSTGMISLFRKASDVLSTLVANDEARIALMNTAEGPAEINKIIVMIKPTNWFNKSADFLEAVVERGNSCG